MQKPIHLIPVCKVFAQASLLIAVIFLLLSLAVNAKAAVPERDSSLAQILRTQLGGNYLLNYPRSVERFYQRNNYKLAWIAPDTIKTHACDAMLLLDCTLQYGLSRNDYHPGEITYERLNAMTAPHEKVGDQQKAAFDILLTDAMITMINNLHFGKLNPVYTALVLDKGTSGDCRAVEVLRSALKKNDLMQAIESVQPDSKTYCRFQGHMRYLAGLSGSDCYEIPKGDIRLLAINMERLRWIVRNDSVYISINIPTYTLKFHQKDKTYPFQIVVGKPATPTPLIQSKIRTVASEQAVITFRSTNAELSMVSFTGKAPLNKRTEKATSDGEIQIRESERLAVLILRNNTADLTESDLKVSQRGNRNRKFTLKRPLPVRTTYITCELGEWELIRCRDIYDLDQKLTNALYQAPESMARR